MPPLAARISSARAAGGGTSTFAIRLNDVWIGPEWIIARDAAAFIGTIRPAFVLLQCGIALGVIQGAIDSIDAVQGPLGHVNQFLDEQAKPLQDELDGLWQRILQLALTPHRRDPSYRLAVLEAAKSGGAEALEYAIEE